MGYLITVEGCTHFERVLNIVAIVKHVNRTKITAGVE